MDKFSELIAAVQSDLTVNSGSSFMNPTAIQLALNRAYYVAGGLHKWPQLEDAKKASTVNGNEYYDYPQNWYPQSIWKLTVDSVDYGDPLTFKDYLYEKENSNPSGLTRMWGSQWTRYFISPTPSADGNKNISIWGSKVVDTMSDDTDTTIFSYNMRECNVALVYEAVHILKMKGENLQATAISGVGEMGDLRAQDILGKAWNRIRMELSHREKTQPMFDVPNFFGNPVRDVKNRIGDF
jgi:hypothetical protein